MNLENIKEKKLKPFSGESNVGEIISSDKLVPIDVINFTHTLGTLDYNFKVSYQLPYFKEKAG